MDRREKIPGRKPGDVCCFLSERICDAPDPYNAGLGYVFLSAFFGALSGAFKELFSPSEYDTITVPAVIAAALLIINSAMY